VVGVAQTRGGGGGTNNVEGGEVGEVHTTCLKGSQCQRCYQEGERETCEGTRIQWLAFDMSCGGVGPPLW
jgi:hypothetical protein